MPQMFVKGVARRLLWHYNQKVSSPDNREEIKGPNYNAIMTNREGETHLRCRSSPHHCHPYNQGQHHISSGTVYNGRSYTGTGHCRTSHHSRPAGHTSDHVSMWDQSGDHRASGSPSTVMYCGPRLTGHLREPGGRTVLLTVYDLHHL